MSCRHPENIVSRLCSESIGYDTHIHANPNSKDGVSGVPLREAGGLRALQVQIHLIDKR
jgi:hypothetical protein